MLRVQYRASDQRVEARALNGRLRVLIVDDHPAVRAGLEQLLGEQPDLTIVEAVASGEAAMAVAEREPVDVAVLDYQLGSRSGLWLSRRLKRLTPPPRVVVFSAYCDGPLAAACVVAEADALVSKSAAAGELCDVLRLVARGATRLPGVPPTLADAMRRRLTMEDQAIFGLLLAGIDRAGVAETLRISEAEVDTRMWGMLEKLQALRPPAGKARPVATIPFAERQT